MKIHPIQLVSSRKGEWLLTYRVVDRDGRYQVFEDRIRAPHAATPMELRAAVRKALGTYKAGAPIYLSEAHGQFKIGSL
jgi:hypothetical protein